MRNKEGEGGRRREEGSERRIPILESTEYPVANCFKPASSMDSENPGEAHRS